MTINRAALSLGQTNLRRLCEAMVQLRACEQKPLTIICGAGLAADAGYPGWAELVHRMSAEIVPPEMRQVVENDVTDLSRRVEYIFRFRDPNRKEDELVRDALYSRREGVLTGSLADSVARLTRYFAPTARILTTNLDDQVERALAGFYPDEELPAFGLRDAESWFDFDGSVPPTLHVHGLVHPQRETIHPLVLSERFFLENGGSVKDVVRRCLDEGPVLLVGVSLTDPNLVGPLSDYHKDVVAGGGPRRAFLLAVADPVPGIDDRQLVWRYAEMRAAMFYDTLGTEVILLKAYSQVSQVLLEVALCLEDPGEYLHNNDPDTSPVYGRRLARVLSKAYSAIGSGDFPEGTDASQLSDRLHQLMLHEDGPVGLIRQWVNLLHSDDLAELGLSHEFLLSEGFALFLWLRARSARPEYDETPPYAIHMVGTSAYSHREAWSSKRTIDITSDTGYPAVDAVYYGTTSYGSLTPVGRYKLWRSAVAAPIVYTDQNGLAVLGNIGAITLHSNRAITPEPVLQDEARRSGQGVQSILFPSSLIFLTEEQTGLLVESTQSAALQALNLQ